MVYVNYARPIDFKMLIEKGVNCSGKIVIARYGHVFRGDKVHSSIKCHDLRRFHLKKSRELLENLLKQDLPDMRTCRI